MITIQTANMSDADTLEDLKQRVTQLEQQWSTRLEQERLLMQGISAVLHTVVVKVPERRAAQASVRHSTTRRSRACPDE